MQFKQLLILVCVLALFTGCVTTIEPECLECPECIECPEYSDCPEPPDVGAGQIYIEKYFECPEGEEITSRQVGDATTVIVWCETSL